MMAATRISRRGFLRAALSGGAGMMLGGVGTYAYARDIEPWYFEVVRHELHLARLPDAFAGMTIAQISNLHFGAWVRLEDLELALSAVQALGADVIVVTGDFLSRITHDEPDMVVQALLGLSAREGVYAVLGNHDWWEDGPLVAQSVQRAAVTQLQNRNVPLRHGGQTLYLAGVDDVWVRRDDLPAALSDVPMSAKAILLAHEPDYADLAARDQPRSFAALRPFARRPGVSARHRRPCLSAVGAQILAVSLHQVGRMMLYTNRGLGMVSLPLRFSCRPEVTLLTLRC